MMRGSRELVLVVLALTAACACEEERRLLGDGCFACAALDDCTAELVGDRFVITYTPPGSTDAVVVEYEVVDRYVQEPGMI